MHKGGTISRSFINDQDRGKLEGHLTELEKPVLYELNSKGSVDLVKYKEINQGRVASINGRWQKADLPFRLVTQPTNEPWEKRYLFLECLRPKTEKSPG